MTTRLVCLANSIKEGGRCIAGIELSDSNTPILIDGHPKWIRPVCNTTYGEVPTHLVSHLNILDIIEIDVTGKPKVIDYHSENVLFRENSIVVIGKFNSENLEQICDNKNLIFENKGKAISEDVISNLTYSLMFVNVDEFEVIQKTYGDNPKIQYRLVFLYNGHEYDLPITDPDFLRNYKINPNLLDDISEIYLSLSVAVVQNKWHSKLVAGIVF